MNVFHAFLLGILQGATEFFPISSSAHASLFRQWLGIEGSLVFDLILHAGTMCSLLIYLRNELFVTRRYKAICLATLPLIPIYFALKPFIGSLNVGFFLIVTAGILFLPAATMRSVKTKDSLLIGAAQGLALFPGLSRSASTITAAKRLGWPIEEAVIFSFLLSIPATCGGMCLEGYKAISTHAVLPPLSICLVGFGSAFLVGLCVIRLAFKLLMSGRFLFFAWYCLLLGIFAIVRIYV